MRHLIKRVGVAISATAVSLSSLLVLGIPVVHATANNCTWNGVTSGNFSATIDWTNCGGGVPQNGDNLVFDNTTLSADATATDDIAGLSVGTITFQGTNANGYTFTLAGSDTLSVSGGITDSSSHALSDQISLNLTLTGPQSFTDTAGAFGLVIGNSAFTNTLNIGSNTLTLNSDAQLAGNGGSITIDSQLQGTGNIVMHGTGNGVYNFQATANSFSGNVGLDNGQAYVYVPTAFGSGAVTVSSGATLNTQFASATPTFSNSLTIGGNGFNGSAGALVVNDGCPTPGNSGVCTDAGTDTFSGPMTLAANTTVGSAGDTVNFSGTLTCNAFTITATPGSTGSLTGVSACGGSSSSTGSSSGTTPKTPDTGLALTSASVALPLFGSLAIAGGLYVLSRKVAQPVTKKR